MYLYTTPFAHRWEPPSSSPSRVDGVNRPNKPRFRRSRWPLDTYCCRSYWKGHIMIALGYVLRDASSAQQKFHSVIVLGDGTKLTRWGATSNSPHTPSSWRGQSQVASPKVVASSAADLSRLWDEKLKKGYEVIYGVSTVELPDDVALDHVYRLFCEQVEAGESMNGDASASPDSLVQVFVASAKRLQRRQHRTEPRNDGHDDRDDRSAFLSLPAGEKVIRPNGQRYLPRDLGGHTDVAVMRRAREKFLPVLLSGSAGTGKSALADGALPDLILVPCHGDMTVEDLVGKFLPGPNGQGWIFQSGPLTQAMEQGRTICLDEVNKMPVEVSAVLHAAMDGRGQLRIDARPDLPMVQAQPGFFVVAMYNPDDLGSSGLSDAILSRFPIQVEVTTDYAAARALGVPSEFVTLAENLKAMSAHRVAKGEPTLWAPEMRELLAAKSIVDAGLGVDFAVSSMVGRCPRPEDMGLILQKARTAGFPDVRVLQTGEQV